MTTTPSSTYTDSYVYRWVRLDTGMPFYIGKGRGRRCHSTHNRNMWFKSILRKTPCKVEIMLKGLTDLEAVTKEIWLIKFYRECGIRLCNMTDGGDGLRGYNPSEEVRKKMSESRKGSVHSYETRIKISTSNKGKNLGKTLSDTTKDRISSALVGITRSDYTKDKISKALRGRKFRDETRVKLSKSARGRKLSVEAKARRSEASRGERNHRYGKKWSAETRAKIADAKARSAKRKTAVVSP